MVQPEDWVRGGSVDVLHNGADTVVTPGMSAALRAASHVGKGGARIASINH